MLSNSRLFPDELFTCHLGQERLGPYAGSVQDGKIILPDQADLDISEHDIIERDLPSGRTESYKVENSTFRKGPNNHNSHWSLRTQKIGQSGLSLATAAAASITPSTSITISGSNVQIGDQNTQQIDQGLQLLIDSVKKSKASDLQKQSLLSKIDSVMRHPLFTSIIGGATGVVLGHSSK